MGSAETKDCVPVTIGVGERVGFGNLELQPTNNNTIPSKRSRAAATGHHFAQELSALFRSVARRRRCFPMLLVTKPRQTRDVVEITVMPELDVEFGDGSSQNLEVTSLGGTRYLLEETALVAEDFNVRLGSTIELKQVSDNRYKFVKLIQAAPGSRHDYILKPSECYSDMQKQAFSREAERIGVKWELIWDNQLILHLPTGVDPVVLMAVLK